MMVPIQQPLGQPDHRGNEEHLAARRFRAFFIEQHELCAERGSREHRRLRWVQDGAGEEPTADLGSTAVLDHRCSRRPHQPRHVGSTRRLAGAAHDPDARQVGAVECVGATPRSHETRHDAEHRHSGIDDEFDEAPFRRSIVVEGQRSAVQQRGIDQPGAHHPSEVRRPRNHVVTMDVVVVATVHCRLDRRRVCPRDRLRLAGGAGGTSSG